MGINLLGTSTCGCPSPSSPAPTGNPNPARFKILAVTWIGRALTVIVRYPDCKNFEGTKVLVFKDVTPEQVMKQKVLDPHFCDSDKHLSPIARFAPTSHGTWLAVVCANAINSMED